MGKNVLRDGETISGALLAGLGVYIFLQSRAWDYYTEDGPGPGFFPYWYGVAMVVLSLALIVSRIRKFEAGQGAPPTGAERDGRSAPGSLSPRRSRSWSRSDLC